MGCTGDREKGPPEHTQKWDFITLSDFKGDSVWTNLAYGWLWFMALVSIAVYAVDTFTAVNLLAFNKWNSQVKPTIPFQYSKWIFAACILLSWILCIYGWIRAVQVLRRGGVAESYMDPLAVTLQSIRGQGWRRFLVFTELTKSKKGADYVAFFVYFAFNGALRVILAEGPRQAINAMTLYAVMTADLVIQGKTNSFSKFWANVEALAKKNDEQAAILFSMLFTLIIWVFSALCLICAAILYVVFLWHYIPQADGRLSVYCRRKIDRRLEKIVEHKLKAASDEEERQRQKAERKAELKRQKTGELPTKLAEPKFPPQLSRQPTLPQLEDSPDLKESESMPELRRADTSTSSVSTLPRYESRPPTRNESQRTFYSGRPGMPSRTTTQGSGWSTQSYESDAPLLSNAGYPGEAMPTMPSAAFSRQGSQASLGRPQPARTMTQSTQATQRSFTPVSRDGSMYGRPPPGGIGRAPPMRSNTGFSFDTEPQSAIGPLTPDGGGYGRQTPFRQNTTDSFQTAPLRQMTPAASVSRQTPAPTPAPMDRRPTYGSLHSQQSSFSRPVVRKPLEGSFNRPFSPASVQTQPPPSPGTYEMTAQPAFTPANEQQTGHGYVALNPSVHSASNTPAPQAQSQFGQPKRNMTAIGAPGAAGNYFGHVQSATPVPQRSATAPIDPRHTTGYGDILDVYGDSASPEEISPRTGAASANPYRGR